MYFTLKYSEYDDDPDAIVQIVETNPAAALTDGLLYIDGAAIVAQITIANGTLTVSQAAGTVAIAINNNATALLAKASDLGLGHQDQRRVRRDSPERDRHGVDPSGGNANDMNINIATQQVKSLMRHTCAIQVATVTTTADPYHPGTFTNHRT